MIKKTLISVAPPKIGGIDFLIPLFFAIKKKEPFVRLELVVIERKLEDEIKSNKFISGELRELSAHVTYLRKGKGIMSYTYSGFRLCIFLTRLLFRKKVFVMHSGTAKKGIMKVIAIFFKYHDAEIFYHKSTMTALFGREVQLPSSLEKGNDGVLLFGSNDACSANDINSDFYYKIGYPKLYDAWLARVIKHGNELRDNILASCNCRRSELVIALFLNSIIKDVFNLEEYEEWLDTVLQVIEVNYPDAIVVIKPHPPIKRYIEIINKRCSFSSLENITILDFHAGVIACAADVIISAHSSVMIDAMSLGKPTVFHHKFTDHWMVRHPETSSFLHFGLPYSSEAESLLCSLNEALSENHLVPDVAHILGHHENLSFLS